jgi:hypothetical protein
LIVVMLKEQGLEHSYIELMSQVENDTTSSAAVKLDTNSWWRPGTPLESPLERGAVVVSVPRPNRKRQPPQEARYKLPAFC